MMANLVRIAAVKRREIAMPTLKDGFEYGLRNNLKGFYLRFSNEELQILKTLTTRQEKKFKKNTLIPYPFMQFFWELGFLPIIDRPTEGMRVQEFINLLSLGVYQDKRHKYQGVWLRDKIEAEEFPETIRNQEMYLRVLGDGHKRTPASYLRDIPGTIIR
jgi:hypothetical protein